MYMYLGLLVIVVGCLYVERKRRKSIRERIGMQIENAIMAVFPTPFEYPHFEIEFSDGRIQRIEGCHLFPIEVNELPEVIRVAGPEWPCILNSNITLGRNAEILCLHKNRPETSREFRLSDHKTSVGEIRLFLNEWKKEDGKVFVDADLVLKK